LTLLTATTEPGEPKVNRQMSHRLAVVGLASTTVTMSNWPKVA
jgi:hypothetical protein